MGGGGKGSSSSTVSIPPEVLARYNSVNSQAQSVAQTPFQQYSTDPNAFVAPLNSVQQSGINQVQQGANAAQPLYGAAEAMTALGSGNVNPQNLQIGKYMSPYLNSVLGSTVAAENLQNAQQSSGLKGQAIQQGAFGGDRADVAQANLAYQQDVANNQTNAGIMNTGFNTGLSAAEQQQGVNLQAGQANQQRILDAANQLSSLGAAQQNAALTGGAAQLAAGQTAQQTQQAGLTALYNQFLQQQAYPFQTTQFLANIAEGTGALSGNTTNTTMSDERLKENIQKIGKTNDGQTIYRYNYKGDDRVQIGLMAQDVEKKYPDAVGLAGGYKTVDYGKATDDAAERGNFRSGGAAEGGLVAPQHSYEGFADGGDAGGDAYLTELLNKLQSNQGMFYPGQGSARSGIGDTTGAYGSAMAEPQQHQMIQGTAAPPPQPSVMDNISSNVSKTKDLYNTGKDVLLGGDKSSGLIGHGGTLDDSLSSGGKKGASLFGDASNFLSKEFASGGLVPRRHRDSGGGMPYSNQVGDTSKLDIPDQKSQNTLQTAGGPHGGGGNMAGQIGSMALGLAGSAVGGRFGGMAGSILGSFLKRGGTADRRGYATYGTVADDVPYPAGATYQSPVDDPNAPDPTEQELKRTDQQINAGVDYLGSGLASGVGLAKDVIKDIPNAYDTLANDAGAVWRKWTTPSDTSQKVTLPTAQSYSDATPPATLSLPNTDTLSLPNTDSTPSGHYELHGRSPVWVPDSQKTGTDQNLPLANAPNKSAGLSGGSFPSLTGKQNISTIPSGDQPANILERRAGQPTLGLVPSTQPNINDGQSPVDGNQKNGGGFWHDIGQELRGAGDWLGKNQNWLVPVGEGLATAASTPTHNFWYAIAQGAGAGLNATQDIQNQMLNRNMQQAEIANSATDRQNGQIRVWENGVPTLIPFADYNANRKAYSVVPDNAFSTQKNNNQTPTVSPQFVPSSGQNDPAWQSGGAFDRAISHAETTAGSKGFADIHSDDNLQPYIDEGRDANANYPNMLHYGSILIDGALKNQIGTPPVISDLVNKYNAVIRTFSNDPNKLIDMTTVGPKAEGLQEEINKVRSNVATILPQHPSVEGLMNSLDQLAGAEKTPAGVVRIVPDLLVNAMQARERAQDAADFKQNLVLRGKVSSDNAGKFATDFSGAQTEARANQYAADRASLGLMSIKTFKANDGTFVPWLQYFAGNPNPTPNQIAKVRKLDPNADMVLRRYFNIDTSKYPVDRTS